MNVDVLLCFELPFLTDELRQEWRECKNDKERERNIEKRTDLFATMLALYPDKETSEISNLLGISEKRITEYASIFGVHKSKEFRSEVNRKNGNHPNKGKQPDAKAVEKVARNGRVVATYRSTTEAARANGIKDKTMSKSVVKNLKIYRDGYLYRYKK